MNVDESSSNFEEFMRTKVYDLAVHAGSQMRGRVDKTTIENLIPIFQRESDTINGALLLMAYIMRQIGRGQIDRNVGRLMLSDLKNIFDSFKSDQEKLRAAIQKYLLLIKWVYESEPRKSVETFEEFVKLYAGGRGY